MTANINPETGIAYGYISANSLHSDVVQELQDGTDPYYEDVMEEAQQETARELANKVPLGVLELDLFVKLKDSDLVTLTEDTLYEAFLEHVKANWSGSDWEQSFNDAYQPDEPIHEGEKDGVRYRTSWLGGALNVWVFESPYTARTVACSPCVPNAGDLDNVGKGDYRCYDVPPDWRDEK